MRHVSKIGIMMFVAVVVATPASGVAMAEEEESSGYNFGLALTIGEGMYFIDDGVSRGPVSLHF